jgi:hypothetical protein
MPVGKPEGSLGVGIDSDEPKGEALSRGKLSPEGGNRLNKSSLPSGNGE